MNSQEYEIIIKIYIIESEFYDLLTHFAVKFAAIHANTLRFFKVNCDMAIITGRGYIWVLAIHYQQLFLKR